MEQDPGCELKEATERGPLKPKRPFPFLCLGLSVLSVATCLYLISRSKAIHSSLSDHRKFPQSALAHKLLDGLRGLEIGGGAHNAFGLNTLNVDYTDEMTDFKLSEIKICGEYMKVDIVASGDDLPFKDNSVDFVISSHVIEHFYDPVKAVIEWLRVVKPGGYVYIIAPHKDRTIERDLKRTPLTEIISRHEHPNPPSKDDHQHYSTWITKDFIDICLHYRWKIIAVQDIDDKVGNGFAIVIQKAGRLFKGPSRQDH